MAFDVALTNLGKYNEGILAYEWVTLPTDSETLAKAFEAIGMDFKQYEDFFISDYELGDFQGLYDMLGEYENLDELNYLAEKLDGLSDYEQEVFLAVCEAEGGNVVDTINQTENLDCYSFIAGISNESDLGAYFIEDAGIYDLSAMGNLANYIDYELFGKDILFEGRGVITDQGYLETMDEPTDHYRGQDDIPEEYTVTGEAVCIIQEKQDSRTVSLSEELDTEENYNNIDGVRNNIKPEKDESKGKPSLVQNLKECKEKAAKQDKAEHGAEPSKRKNTDLER